jgi:flap endonuclease-1
MGIDGLYKFINNNCSEIYETVNIQELYGNYCIIDGMQHTYSQLIYLRSKKKEVFTEDGKNISHLYGLINSLTYYLKYGMIPIFIFDGKYPDIKKKKIEERRSKLKENLNKLNELKISKNNCNEILNSIKLDNELDENLNNETDDNCFIYGTPPSNLIDSTILKLNKYEDEYQQIYKKTIVLKNYYIDDWINIISLLGLPVFRAKSEADPLCSYICKNNKNIYGVMSDDSDMLIFGSPLLMKKTMNQNFSIIKLNKLLDQINLIIEREFNDKIEFDLDNLIEFSILLGSDYGVFNISKSFSNSLDLLKFYINSDKDINKILDENEISEFLVIKTYYQNKTSNENCEELLKKPFWKKPKLNELKQVLTDLNVNKLYVNKNIKLLNSYYYKFKKMIYSHCEYTQNNEISIFYPE